MIDVITVPFIPGVAIEGHAPLLPAPSSFEQTITRDGETYELTAIRGQSNTKVDGEWVELGNEVVYVRKNRVK